MFADDSKAIGAAADNHEHGLVQNDLSAIVTWSKVNHFSLSTQKCVCLHYGVNNKKHSYHINGILITDSNKCTDLGVLRTVDFKYKTHIDAVCLKAECLSGMVAKQFATRYKEFLIKLFSVYIRSHLEYASVISSHVMLVLMSRLNECKKHFK